MKKGPWLLVLGANSDMAIEVAKYYAQNGYNLFLASRNVDKCEKNAADIQIRYNVTVKTVAFDAKQYNSHKSFYTNLDFRPQGVIVAFGCMHDQKQAQANFEMAQDMVETNFVGALSILEIIAADFEQQNQGFIVGISSVAGDRGRQSNYIYGSTKAAFTAYLAGLRHRLITSNVSVLTVKPGFVKTKMTENLDLPLKLTANPEQVARSIYKGVAKKKSTIYVKPIWRLIMLLIIHAPNLIFNKTKL